MPRRTRRVLAAAAYLLGVLVFFEAAARLALGSESMFRRLQGEDEATWRLRWVSRHRKQGTLYFAFDEHHPRRGWALKPNLRELPVFHGKRLSSNARGLRGRQEHEYAKPPGVRRVVVLGDSYTFGEEVGDEETYSARLASLLPGVEVLNLGVHGYGLDQMLIYLQEEGVRYQPDVVLLGYLYLDMERGLLGFRDYAKPRFVLRDGGLRLRGVPVPTPAEMLRAEPWRSKFLDLWTMLEARLGARLGFRAREEQRLTAALLDAIADTARAAGAKPAFAYLPAFGEITRNDLSMTRNERFFFSHCRQRGIQTMHLQRFFRDAARRGVELNPYGHWTPAEHAIAAEGMKAYLLEKGLLPGG